MIEKEKEETNDSNNNEEEEENPRQKLLDELCSLIFYYHREVEGVNMMDIISCLEMMKLHLFFTYNADLVDWDKFDEYLDTGMIT